MSFGRTAARDGNQVRFLPAAQLALPARPRPVVDGGFESLIDEPSPRSGDSEGAYRNRLEAHHLGHLEARSRFDGLTA